MRTGASSVPSAASPVSQLRRIEREVTVLLHRVRRTSLENAHHIHPELQPAGYSVLLVVADREPVRASDVVEQLGVDKGAVSRSVAQLEQLGLVRRSCDPDDRRAQTLVVTDEGRERLDGLTARRRADVAGRLSAWTDAELAAFADQLGRYNATLEA